MKKNSVALHMGKFEINTVIISSKDDIDCMVRDFKTAKDSEWCNGMGKQYMHLMLLETAKSEDAYFKKHMHEAVQSNQRWIDFCDDCAILVALDSVLYNAPIVALHPDSFRQSLTKCANKHGIEDNIPVIPGIEILQ
ncbi:MAG: hypothetical protein RL744_1738 [Pseudomonadota bacterium]|jgi:hypothetical protein